MKRREKTAQKGAKRDDSAKRRINIKKRWRHRWREKV